MKMFYSIFIVLTIINVIYGEIDAGCRVLDPREKVYICPQILAPVCGSNKHTYGNMCDYCAERWKKQQDGESWGVVLDHEGSCESGGADVEKPATDPVFSDVPVEPGYQSEPIWSDQPYHPSTPYIQRPQTGQDLFHNLVGSNSPARHDGKFSWNWLNWFKQRPTYWFHGGYRPNTQYYNHRPNWNQDSGANRYGDGQPSSSSWSAGGFHPNAHSYGNGDYYGNNANNQDYNYGNSPNNQDYNYGNGGQYDRYRPSLFDRFSSVMENKIPAYRPQTTTSWRRVNCNEFGNGCAQAGMVCGSNRRYYSNECELCQTITQTGINVKFVKDGQC